MTTSRPLRRTRLMLRCLALPLVLAIPLVPALAAEPVEEHADNWLNSHGGGESASQWAVRQLTTDLATRVVGPAATGTKKEIADRVTAEVRRLAEAANNPCAKAAAAQAVDLALVIERRETMNGAASMFFGALGGAAGGAGNAEKMVEYFGRELAEEIFKAVREKSMDRLKGDIRDFFKEQAPETDQASDSRGGCQTFFRMVWDKSGERYQFIIVGDCGCKPTPSGVRLSRWSIQGSGSVVPSLQVGANGELSVRFAVGPAKATLTASCCDAAGKRFFARCPDRGEGGDGWVGVIWQAPPAPPTGRNGPPVIIPRGGTRTGTAPPPPAPEPTAFDLMELPDGAFQDLYDRVIGDADHARSADAEAYRKLDDLRKDPNASPEAIKAAEDKLAAAQETRIEAERKRAAMMEAMRARAQRNRESQQQQQQQQQEEESSGIDDSAAGRSARADAFGQFLGGAKLSSGTDVAVPITFGYPDFARVARADASRAAFEATRLHTQVHEAQAEPPSEEAFDAVPTTSLDYDPAPRADAPPPAVEAPTIAQSTVPMPLSVESATTGIEGTWALQNTAAGVSRIAISRGGNGFVLSGLGQPLLLEQAGNSWFGSGAVLFGQGGHEVRLDLQDGRLTLSAENGSGGQFSTLLSR